MIARIFRGRVHYGWVVAAATFVVLLTAAGFRATPGVLLLPLQHEFGWSPALIGGAVAVNLLVYGLGAPFAAAIVERFGLRRVTVIALTMVAVGAALTTQMTSPWQLYLLWGLVVGGATGAVAVPLAAIVANRWFSTRRGLVTGMLTASNASGQLVFLPLLAWVVTSYSWRAAAALIALTAILVVVPVALVFLRTDPADVGLMPYGAVEPEPPRRLVNPFRNAVGALRDAVRVRDFWLLAGAFFICGATTNGLIQTHLVPACMDHGIPEVKAAGLLATMGVFDLVGTTASGWLSDRYDNRRLLAVYYGLRGLALLYLPLAFGTEVFGLPAFAIFYGLDWIATVPPTLRLTVDAVGPVDGPIVFGWIFTAHQLGAGFGALAAGIVRTEASTYTPAWLGAGIICLIATAIVLRIGRAAPRPAPALAPSG